MIETNYEYHKRTARIRAYLATYREQIRTTLSLIAIAGAFVVFFSL